MSESVPVGILSEEEKRRLVEAVAHFDKLVELYSSAIESASERYASLASALRSGTAARAQDEEVQELFPAFAPGGGGRVRLHRSGSVDVGFQHQRAVPSSFEALARRVFPGKPKTYTPLSKEEDTLASGAPLHIVDLYTAAAASKAGN